MQAERNLIYTYLDHLSLELSVFLVHVTENSREFPPFLACSVQTELKQFIGLINFSKKSPLMDMGNAINSKKVKTQNPPLSVKH